MDVTSDDAPGEGMRGAAFRGDRPVMAQSSRSSGSIRDEVPPGLWCIRPMLRALRECEIASRLREFFRSLSGTETCSKLFSGDTLSVLLRKGRRHSLVLGAIIKQGAQPSPGTSLADLNNSRCDSLIGCYGISGLPFIASDNLCERSFLRSSLITTTASAQNLAPSRFDIPRGLATYGVTPQRKAHRAKGHMP